MANFKYSIHARERVAEFVPESDLHRLVLKACDAAEQSPNWKPGDEFIFEIGEEDYVYADMELSSLIVCHKGTAYEVFYYDGMMAEVINATCSWDR